MYGTDALISCAKKKLAYNGGNVIVNEYDVLFDYAYVHHGRYVCHAAGGPRLKWSGRTM